MNGLTQTLRNLGIVRLGALAAVAALSVAFFVFLTGRIAAPGFGLLYSNLDLRDSGQIVQKLEALSVPYQLRGDGGSILVPTDQVARLRMLMADDGLPHGGSVGYEIFDRSDTFGTSSFVENINQVRALEGELARTISSLDVVQSARVHLVLPRREIFSRERENPSASIVIKMRGVGRPTAQQVAAVQHLVAAAVPDLTPSRVSVVDTEGNLLARGDGGEGGGDALSSNSAEEMRVNYENRTQRQIEELIERSLGPGKARVDVHAEMDFDRTTTNSESYDPNGQVVRSTQTVTESNDSTEGGNGGQAVSVSNNLPNAQAQSANANAGRTKGARNEETVNYEISKTVRNQVQEAGEIKRVSVAVVVDGTTTTQPDGSKKYEPRSPEEMKQIAALVRSAIGYDEKRGDTVEVANLRFASVDEPPPTAPASFMGFEKEDLMKMGETLVLALVAVLVILLVIRPLINRLLEVATAAPGAPVSGLLGAGAAAALPPPRGGTALVHAGQAAANAVELSEAIDMGQVEGRVASSQIRKVTEIVEKHPEEALAIVRSWMYQDNR